MATKFDLRKRKTKPKVGLNQKQALFVEAYLSNGMNGAAAARAAGYNCPHVQATRLLKEKHVQDHISYRVKELQDELDIQRQDLVNIMRRVLTFNTMRIGKKSKDGFIEIDADEWDRIADEIGDLVVESEVKSSERETAEGGTVRRTVVRIKLMSKDKMFELAMKYKGMLKPDGGSININMGQQTINFDELCDPPDGQDVIEGRIVSEGE